MRKKSKQSISLIQRKIWELCKRITRSRYENSCYTCGAKNLTGSNCHTGHLWAKASLGAKLKYDLRVLRLQCYKCNIHHGGRGADFYKRMLAEIGPQRMAELEMERNVSVKAYDHYVKVLEDYKELVKDLEK